MIPAGLCEILIPRWSAQREDGAEVAVDHFVDQNGRVDVLESRGGGKQLVQGDAK